MLFPSHTFDKWRPRKGLKDRCQKMTFRWQRHSVHRRNRIALRNNTWRTAVCLWISLYHLFSEAFSYKFIVPCCSFWQENAGHNSTDLPSYSSSSVTSSISELVYCPGKSPHRLSQETEDFFPEKQISYIWRMLVLQVSAQQKLRSRDW